MLGHRYILTAAITCGLLSATFASAKPLSKAEHAICPSLRVCVDIIKRHDASEFDYAVLEREFDRFQGKGRRALFDILKSKHGNPEIADMILALGPVTAQEVQSLNNAWSIEKAGQFLLLLKDSPDAFDKVLLTLGHADPNVREAARQAVVMSPERTRNIPLENDVVGPMLTALIYDPMSIMAPFVAKAEIGLHSELFATLIGSGDPALATAAYEALYRQDPKMAFEALLSEMRRINSPQQARAIGDLLTLRNKGRNDGFYLKFAKDISVDSNFPIPAQAAGLHAMIKIGKIQSNPALSRDSKPLAFLISEQGFVAQDIYVPALKRAEQEAALATIVETSQSESWINRDRITQSLKGTPLFDGAVRDLIYSDDIRSVRAGLRFASTSHENLIKSQINNPVFEISAAARGVLGSPEIETEGQKTCRLAPSDLDGVTEQMPFFDSPWFITHFGARVSATRKTLTSAHPTPTGWLAGYDLDKLGPNTVHSGGGLVSFDNKAGAFRHIGNFNGPIAILPNRTLKLGQTTSRFWVVDSGGPTAPEVSLYQLDVSAQDEVIQRIGILPPRANDFSVAPNGDFLVTFLPNEDASVRGLSSQRPLRYAADGKLSLACRPSMSSAPSRTLN